VAQWIVTVNVSRFVPNEILLLPPCTLRPSCGYFITIRWEL